MGQAGADRSFKSRVNRVEAAGAPYEQARGQVSVLPDWKREVAQKLELPMAFLLGAIAVLVVRLLLFHQNGTALISATPDRTMAVEASAAIVLCIVAFLVLPFRGLPGLLAQFAGVAATVVLMHNAVHSAPGIFSIAFSPTWTDEVIAATEEKSIYFRGETIPIAPPSSAEKKMPTVLRLN
jgi:hypothetical protein